MIDTHCHLTAKAFTADRDAVIGRMREAQLDHAILIGTGIEDAQAAIALADQHPDLLSVSAGLDPFTCHQLGAGFAAALEELDTLLATGRCCAVGEYGLEYHHQVNPREQQIEQLHAQLTLAEKHDLPVVIHVRDAHDDMAAVLGEHPQNHGVIHSFTAGPGEAESYLTLGWHLAFNGVMTFKNAPEVREAAQIVPDDRLLVETDSPYLAPVPKRGKRCEPQFVFHTAELLAELRGSTPQVIDELTSANARSLFNLATS